MSRSTPWGAAQQVITHLRGFATVSTAGHGGMMISRGAAEKHLSEAALKRALKHGDYYCYEQDCDFFIPLFDAKPLRRQLMSNFPFWENKTEAEIESYLIQTLSDWHPDYLIDKGVEPAEVPYKKWLLRKERDKAHARKDPNLVICCYGDDKSLIRGVIKVLTADAKDHLVTSDSYKQAIADPYNSIYTSLEHLELVSQDGFPPMEERLVKYALDRSEPFLKQINDKTEAAVKESIHGFYGPRSRFNSCFQHAIFEVEAYLKDKKGLPAKEVDQIIKAKLAEIVQVIDDEFKSCRVFKGCGYENAA